MSRIGRVAWIVLPWHSGIADNIALAEFAFEARHELAVPAIVDAFAGSLNKEDLLSHRATLLSGHK